MIAYRGTQAGELRMLWTESCLLQMPICSASSPEFASNIPTAVLATSIMTQRLELPKLKLT